MKTFAEYLLKLKEETSSADIATVDQKFPPSASKLVMRKKVDGKLEYSKHSKRIARLLKE